MKFALYSLYWVCIAPIVFMVTLDVLLYPVSILTSAIWKTSTPPPVGFILTVTAVFAFVVAGSAIWWVWRPFRASVIQATESHTRK
jgi:hypothetical protein